jgi:hypothetical protein
MVNDWYQTPGRKNLERLAKECDAVVDKARLAEAKSAGKILM